MKHEIVIKSEAICGAALPILLTVMVAAFVVMIVTLCGWATLALTLKIVAML